MKALGKILLIGMLVILTQGHSVVLGQQQGLSTIQESELRYHLDFLGSSEFRGRETPSNELEIATLYLGNWAKHAGLKPFMTDGSFYQTIPITVTSVKKSTSSLRIVMSGKEHVYYYEDSFGGSFNQTASCSGEVVFVGLGVVNSDNSWDDLAGLDIFGKIVMILDEQQPNNKFDLGATYSYRLSSRIREIRNRGAAGVLVIVNPELQAKMNSGQKIFLDIPSGRMAQLYDSQRRGTPGSVSSTINRERPVRPLATFMQANISHGVASSILGISEDEVAELFYSIREGKKVLKKSIESLYIDLDVEVERESATTRNVLGMIEGTDPKLKNEYIVICAHHDHLGISDGEIIAGADDNGTGTVALIEIAEALIKEPTKRSVIIAWFTGEERGFIGSQYFINNSVVDIEKIDACLNMDMLGRNDPDSLFLVGSDLLSSQLDATIHKANKEFNVGFNFDYTYSNLTHPQSVYFRSDQYPHIRFGIPSVWYFGGFTHDYHTPRDILEFIDYGKMHRVTKLVYLTAFELGNLPEMINLDVNPEVTSRGKHNLPTRSLFENQR